MYTDKLISSQLSIPYVSVQQWQKIKEKELKN